MKTKAIKFFKNHKIAFIFFTFILLFSFTVPGHLSVLKVDSITYAYHAVDYSMGFCTKFLPGAIYNFIFRHPDEFTVNLWENILLICFWICLSFLLERLYLSYDKDKSILTLIFLFISGPYTFSIFCVELGMLDVYWIYFTIIALFLLSKKQLYPLLIVIPFLMVLVHYSSALCYIPFIFLMMLFKASKCESVSEKRLLIIYAVLFLLVCIVSTLYFVVYENSNLVYSMDEFNSILNSRGADYLYYYDYSLYRHTFEQGHELSPDLNSNIGFEGVLARLFQQISINFDLIDFKPFIPALVITCPILILIYSVFISTIKSSENKLLNTTLLFVMLMFPATIFLSLTMSTDVVRWFSHAFIALFASLLYMLYFDGKKMIKTLNKYFYRIPPNIIFAYFMIYLVFRVVVYD